MTDSCPETPREERLRREARALRDNLLRRKAQARDRTAGGRDEHGDAAPPTAGDSPPQPPGRED